MSVVFRSHLHWGVPSYLASLQCSPGGRHQRQSHRWPGTQHRLQQGRQHRLHWVPGGLQSGSQAGQQRPATQRKDGLREVLMESLMIRETNGAMEIGKQGQDEVLIKRKNSSWSTQDEPYYYWSDVCFFQHRQQVDMIRLKCKFPCQLLDGVSCSFVASIGARGSLDIHQELVMGIENLLRTSSKLSWNIFTKMEDNSAFCLLKWFPVSMDRPAIFCSIFLHKGLKPDEAM